MDGHPPTLGKIVQGSVGRCEVVHIGKKFIYGSGHKWPKLGNDLEKFGPVS
jgi:hypothetical protein